MACSANKKRVLAVRLEDVLQPCLDLILQMACIYNVDGQLPNTLNIRFHCRADVRPQSAKAR